MIKTRFSCWCLIFFSFTSWAQAIFCPPGARWEFLSANSGAAGQEYKDVRYNIKAIYDADAVIDGHNCKVLLHNTFFRDCDNTPRSTFLKQIGDTIWFQNFATNNSWQVLYNFACKAGEGWQTRLTGSTFADSLIYDITVDSITHVLENNMILKKMYLNYQTSINLDFHMPEWSIFSYKAPVTERYGGPIYIFNFDDLSSGFCDLAQFSQPLCYYDHAFGQRIFSNLPCGYSNHLGTGEQSTDNKISVYPQPASQQLNISMSTDNLYTIRVLDLHARLLISHQFQGRSSAIETATLARGMYFLQVTKNTEILTTRKIIIE